MICVLDAASAVHRPIGREVVVPVRWGEGQATDVLKATVVADEVGPVVEVGQALEGGVRTWWCNA